MWAFIFKMKYIRRKIIAEIAGSPQKQKAVAFAILLKEKTNNSSAIRNFSLYKIQRLTQDIHGKNGMAYKTIRKYLSVLEKMGLAEQCGNDLIIRRMSSDAKHRNFNISCFKIDRNKNVYNQIRELIFLVIQAQKDFFKSLLRLRKDPQKGTDFKKVRRLCKKCCNNPNADYEEYGLSYNRIAYRIGCCSRTAIKIVKDAIRRKWCTKENHCEVVRMDGVHFREIPGYAFTTQNYGFILRPNTYTLSRAWSCALGADAQAVVCAGVRKEVW